MLSQKLLVDDAESFSCSLGHEVRICEQGYDSSLHSQPMQILSAHVLPNSFLVLPSPL